VGIFRVQETCVEAGFVAEEEETFRVSIEPTQRIDVFRKAKFREGTVRGAIGSELGEDSVRFMEGDQHMKIRNSSGEASLL
jgi:hypothetical protein